MTVTFHVAGSWSVLLLAVPMIGFGLAMMWRPEFLAKLQSDYYRKRYGIIAGPIGAGTRLFYFCQGIFVASMGFALIFRAVIG